jgi:hypothetical protein
MPNTKPKDHASTIPYKPFTKDQCPALCRKTGMCHRELYLEGEFGPVQACDQDGCKFEAMALIIEKIVSKTGISPSQEGGKFGILEVIVGKIKKDSGIELSGDLKKRFEQASKRYIADKDLIDPRPRRSEVAARFKKLIKGTEKFLEMLRETDDWTKQYLDAQRSEYVGLCSLDDTRQRVSEFLTTCENALHDLPEDTGGRNKELLALYIYIASLASIYEEATGKKPTVFEVHKKSGGDRWHGRQFIDFVTTCLNAIGHPTDEVGFLPGRVEEALSSKFIKEIIYWS